MSVRRVRQNLRKWGSRMQTPNSETWRRVVLHATKGETVRWTNLEPEPTLIAPPESHPRRHQTQRVAQRGKPSVQKVVALRETNEEGASSFFGGRRGGRPSEPFGQALLWASLPAPARVKHPSPTHRSVSSAISAFRSSQKSSKRSDQQLQNGLIPCVHGRIQGRPRETTGKPRETKGKSWEIHGETKGDTQIAMQG